jgi:hypothetical protein
MAFTLVTPDGTVTVAGTLTVKVVPLEYVPVRAMVSVDVVETGAAMVIVVVTGVLVMFVLPEARIGVRV